jgi:hypothetical protein
MQGRCLAGRKWTGKKAGDWVRPVSAREHEEVSEYERQYEDGSDPRLLDIIKIPLLEARPKLYQRENWLLDPENYWEKIGNFPKSSLPTLVQEPGILWLNGYSTQHGLHDKIPVDRAGELDSSLRFIRSIVKIKVFAPSRDYGDYKRKILASFDWGGVQYKMKVTDPGVERQYLALADGEHNLGERFMTLSLGEPFQGNIYKLIAAII